ncbi:MAG: STAS-like domain-containing protein [Bdellovibrionia bacterium]
MKDLVPVKNGVGNLSGEEHARDVYVRIVQALEREGQVDMDMGGIESLSPSFAYEAFGKLVDRFGPTVNNKIRFENDPLHLSIRIVQALERRKRVVEINAKNR